MLLASVFARSSDEHEAPVAALSLRCLECRDGASFSSFVCLLMAVPGPLAARALGAQTAGVVALGRRAQSVEPAGVLVGPQHVGSSQIRGMTRVCRIGRSFLYH